VSGEIVSRPRTSEQLVPLAEANGIESGKAKPVAGLDVLQEVSLAYVRSTTTAVAAGWQTYVQLTSSNLLADTSPEFLTG